jgi:DNA-binding SARP family transcriptional activator
MVRREVEASLSSDLESDIGALNLCECARVYLSAGLLAECAEVASKAVSEASKLGMKFVAVRARAIWCAADPSRLREQLTRALTDSLYRGYDDLWVLREPELGRRLLTQALAMEIEPEYSRSLLGRLGIPTLRVRVFGGLRVWVGEREVTDADWTRPKARSLFAYLSVRSHRVIDPADVLELFWPLQEIDEARNSLRVAVSYIRKALEPGRPKGSDSTYLQYDGQMILLNPGEAGWVDADAFGRLAERVFRPGCSPEEKMRLAERALELVSGQCLPEYHTDPALEDDCERYNARVRDVRRELARAALASGNPEVALSATRAILDNDPLDEPAVLLEVQALKALGQTPEARQTLSEYLRRWTRKAKAPASKPVRDLAATLWRDPAREFPEALRGSFMN